MAIIAENAIDAGAENRPPMFKASMIVVRVVYYFTLKVKRMEKYHVDAFDSDCDEAPTASAIFMARLFPAGSINGDVVGPTYDSNILSEISENAMLRAQLQENFYEPQQNHQGTSVNTKLAKPSTSGNELYSVTLLPKTQFLPKVVEKNDLSKTTTSHLHTNKVIEKCTKVLAPSLLRIEFEPINTYFKNNKTLHRDYLKVTKEHVETLQELLEHARALKPTEENLDYA
ncbi:hypothetical protein Tco_1338377 [Tanacetum coccineum]